MEVAMATHTHTRPLLPVQRFAVGHPYAADWLLLTLGTLAALLLWLWNS
jgi:hypothetical protein